MQSRCGGATPDIPKAHLCGQCGELCDILVVAAVGTATRIWKCPMMLGTDVMDLAVAQALVRAALEDSLCIVIRTRDLSD